MTPEQIYRHRDQTTQHDVERLSSHHQTSSPCCPGWPVQHVEASCAARHEGPWSAQGECSSAPTETRTVRTLQGHPWRLGTRVDSSESVRPHGSTAFFASVHPVAVQCLSITFSKASSAPALPNPLEAPVIITFINKIVLRSKRIYPMQLNGLRHHLII